MTEVVKEVKLIHRTAGGSLVRSEATLCFTGGRIEFLKSPFALKDEIKAMAGSKWHGYADPPRKIWSVEDNQRNRFQLGYLMGEDVYAWFDQEVKKHEYTRPLKVYQMDLADHFLTYHYGIMAAEMGVGKTLAAQEVMERSGIKDWWWIGPKTSLAEHPARVSPLESRPVCPRRDDELRGPGTHHGRVGTEIPRCPKGWCGDESSRCKGATSQRTDAMQRLADMIREKHGFEGYVIEMSGTPSPKSPLDWWRQCEIAWPGFLKEGSLKALEERLAFLVDHQFDAGVFKKRIGWKDDEHKCKQCGQLEDADRTLKPDDPTTITFTNRASTRLPTSTNGSRAWSSSSTRRIASISPTSVTAESSASPTPAPCAWPKPWSSRHPTRSPA